MDAELEEPSLPYTPSNTGRRARVTGYPGLKGSSSTTPWPLFVGADPEHWPRPPVFPGRRGRGEPLAREDPGCRRPVRRGIRVPPVHGPGAATPFQGRPLGHRPRHPRRFHGPAASPAPCFPKVGRRRGRGVGAGTPGLTSSRIPCSAGGSPGRPAAERNSDGHVPFPSVGLSATCWRGGPGDLNSRHVASPAGARVEVPDLRSADNHTILDLRRQNAHLLAVIGTSASLQVQWTVEDDFESALESYSDRKGTGTPWCRRTCSVRRAFYEQRLAEGSLRALSCGPCLSRNADRAQGLVSEGGRSLRVLLRGLPAAGRLRARCKAADARDDPPPGPLGAHGQPRAWPAPEEVPQPEPCPAPLGKPGRVDGRVRREPLDPGQLHEERHERVPRRRGRRARQPVVL